MSYEPEHLSASSIGTFMHCQTQWYFRYPQGIKTPPAVAMAQGTGVHKAAETNYRDKMETYEDVDEATLLDVARDAFQKASEDVDWSREEDKPAEAVDQTIGMTKVWRRDLAPTVQPLSVERKILLTHESWIWPILGFVDTDTTENIIDLKTAGKKKNQADLERDVQSGIYLLDAYWRFTPQTFVWHVAVKTKTPTTQVVERETFNPDKVIALVAHEQMAIRTACESGVFGAAAPDWWGCSEKMCGYWHMCRWGGRP